ncbi:MAG: hypothetical protein GC200_03045 [Tepidisphaera sp.]|nr:hypothetical protein [Tepidisphaera sp.]
MPSIFAAAGVAALAGCATTDEPVIKAGSLTPADFTDGGPFVVVAVAPSVSQSQGAGQPGSSAQPIDLNHPGIASLPAGVDVIGPATAAAGAGPTQGVPGAPTLGAGDQAKVGPAQFVDARVGDINGKPIFASQFFDTGTPSIEPLSRQLMANAQLVRDRKMDVPTWEAEATRQIATSLRGLVQDELFRAEAVASLTPQQKQGLFSFLQELQENLRRESGGSREAARRRIEEEGLTPEEYVRRREELALIGQQLQTKVARRVNVTWRDITQAYNGRFYARYHPPQQYLFRLIIIRADDAAAKEQVESALAKGTPFEQVAKLPLNGSRAAKAGLETRAITGDVKDLKFFPDPTLDAVAHSLSPGQTSAPISLGSQLAWLHFDSIENNAKTLYDAQLEIYNALYAERLTREQNKYYGLLLSHASVTSLVEMQNKLLQIAEERYLKPALGIRPN